MGQSSSLPSSSCPVQLFVVDIGRETVLAGLAFDFVVVVHFYHIWQQMPAEGLDGVHYVGKGEVEEHQKVNEEWVYAHSIAKD